MRREEERRRKVRRREDSVWVMEEKNVDEEREVRSKTTREVV